MEKVQLDYQSSTATHGGLAKTSLVLGAIGVATSIFCVGMVPGVVAIVVGTVARNRIQRDPRKYYGVGFAKAGQWLGAVSILVPLLMALLLPSFGTNCRLSTRSMCAANTRGIMQSMNVYAADNGDVYPVLPYSPYRVANAGTLADTVTAANQDAAIKTMYGGSGAQDGSVLASAWLLVLKNYCSPKQFICPQDPFNPTRAGAPIDGGTCAWHINFSKPEQMSYSFAYPYAADGAVGAWWKNTTDSALPIMSDIAPLNGTGKPTRNVSPGAMPTDPNAWNSINHQGDGQNVGFADGHAEFVRRPDCGEDNDNIFTVSGIKGVSQFGGTQPGKAPLTILTDKSPFDIVMVPARNLDTGGI